MSTIASLKEKKSTNIKNKNIKIALVGNPNCGKTTLFNQLTGSSQHVGNWPGVTVEKKEGSLKFRNVNIDVLDLPGIYSLSPYSSEEVITRNSLIDDNPDVIINIVDATILERNLYLTTQLLELQKPMIIAFNMTDVIEKKGDIIDYNAFRTELNVPIVPISANKGIGIKELLDLAVRCAESKSKVSRKNIYDDKIEKVISKIENELAAEPNFYKMKNSVNLRWLAIKIFENDELVIKKIKLPKNLSKNIDLYRKMLSIPEHVDEQMVIADQRYKYIYALCKSAIKRKHPPEYITLTDRIDKIVTNKFLAVPIFALIMIFIFYITFGPIGSFFRIQFEFFIKDVFGGFILNLLTNLGAAEWSKSLIVGGIIEGVGSVISFLPQVMILFTLLSILEDSGYMARAAFITDKLLRKVGLSGRAFVPLLMGFGCTVPAVLGTRILEKENDKKLTILMIPFMSCSAKMPVYAMFIAALFKEHQVLAISSIYLLGILVAIFTAMVFKKPVLKGETASFIMELPEYRLPTFKNLCLHVGERVKDFIVKAGTILVAATIIIWFLQSFNLNFQMVADRSQSILASIGMGIAPIFSLCGFGDWRAAVSLLSGLIAKESVVSTMAVLYGTGGLDGISHVISEQFTTISAYAFMVFVLLYTPCIAALSAIHKELKSTKWTIIAIGYQLILAWVASVLVYQIGTLVFNIF
ncbi:ferrous iron transport protein B [Clostridium sp. CAG:557]|nr:ferrous iron transport protein B [Clostridium sp. CAG:557]